MKQNVHENKSNSEDVSLADLFAKISSIIKYVKNKIIYVVIFAICGALLGLWYAAQKKTTYSAVCTFVLDDAKGGGGGGYSGLAALVGINMGDGGGGIFEGNNILELYKSRSMIEKTLLTSCVFNGKKQMLIDRLLDYYKLRGQLSNGKIDRITFNEDPDNFTRKQDSVVTVLVGLINKKILTVTKPDKSLNIISVQVVTEDELFSKYFTDKIVQTVNDFYTQTKTKKATQNLQLLQRQADSIRMILSSSISSVASANDSSPDANPLMSSLKVRSQKKQVDVQANTAIYSQIMQNLELAKIQVRQETPLIQVIDKPVFPLTVISLTKQKGMLIGALLFAFLTVIGLACKKIFT